MKNNIKKVYLGLLHNSTWLQIMYNFIENVEQHPEIKEKISILYGKLLPLIPKAENATNLPRQSYLTPELTTIDKERTNVFYSLKKMVKGRLNFFENDKKTSAKRLIIPLDECGNVFQEDYLSKTATLSLLVENFRERDAADIEKLGLQDFVEELDKKNTEFMEKWQLRIDETAKNLPDIKFPVVKKKTNDIYDLIIAKIEVLVAEEGFENYKMFINEWNEIVSSFQTLIMKKRGRKAE